MLDNCVDNFTHTSDQMDSTFGWILDTDRRHTESALYQDRPGLSVDDGGLDLLPPEDQWDNVRGFLGQRRHERAGVSYLK